MNWVKFMIAALRIIGGIGGTLVVLWWFNGETTPNFQNPVWTNIGNVWLGQALMWIVKIIGFIAAAIMIEEIVTKVRDD